MRNKIYPIPILNLAFFDKHLECLIKLLYEVASESAVTQVVKTHCLKLIITESFVLEP